MQADLRTLNLNALVVTHLPNLRYLTGLTATAGAVVLHQDSCTLVVDFRYQTAASRLLEETAGRPFNISVVEHTYDETLSALLRVLPRPARIGVEAASMTVGSFNRLARGLSAPGGSTDSGATAVLVPTERVIERRRAVKDAEEIEIFREAARRLSRVARKAPEFVTEGRTELEIAAAIDAAIREEGFERPAFDTIVASGENSSRPHARPSRRRLVHGDGVVLDFGGVYDGYSVDLTRTLPVGAVPSDLARLGAAVREAHDAAIAAVRPGVRPSEIDHAARAVLARHGLADAFGHGTGHGLGLEVHEDPRISKLPGALPDEPVVPGMVFTIEPGAYVPGVGGVRIEDDVLVVESGCEVLTDVPIGVL
ncbi:MAG TPA: Xaa-Pro peptidase family protein [Vicinamibacterales bacterium]|nr:Xaa-Pro peptidase family protein [Vicinamibacterales bacterium]